MLKPIARKLDPEPDAINLIEADHRTVEELFAKFQTADRHGKLHIANQICADVESELNLKYLSKRLAWIRQRLQSAPTAEAA
ncbi:MAG: hypothetical protein ACT4PZ_24725 [Panacagrimonas sp.]